MGTYKCANCGGVFKEGWTEEDAKKEAETMFGKPVDDWKEDGVVVCDDCYQVFLKSVQNEDIEECKKTL